MAAAQQYPESYKRLTILENAANDSMKREQPVNEVWTRALGPKVTVEDLAGDKEQQMACMCG